MKQGYEVFSDITKLTIDECKALAAGMVYMSDVAEGVSRLLVAQDWPIDKANSFTYGVVAWLMVRQSAIEKAGKNAKGDVRNA